MVELAYRCIQRSSDNRQSIPIQSHSIGNLDQIYLHCLFRTSSLKKRHQ
jgi:hypothetical protein